MFDGNVHQDLTYYDRYKMAAISQNISLSTCIYIYIYSNIVIMTLSETIIGWYIGFGAQNGASHHLMVSVGIYGDPYVLHCVSMS